MLPSSGYFLNVVCPFFKSGLCERPHCHFKHIEPDVDGQAHQWAVTDSNFEPPLSDVAFSSIADSNGSTPQSYIPTPVDKCTPKSGGILKTTAAKYEKPTVLVPEYRPTPISRLKDRCANSSGLDTSSLNANVRKRKKCEEYDPEEVKFSRRKVSFDLPVSNDDVVTVDDSEEEEDYGTDSAKFSDDDDDDCDIKERANSQPAITVKKEQIEKTSEKINEFSLVDKILIDVSKNEEYIKSFKKPVTALKNCDKYVKSAGSVNTVEKVSTTLVAASNVNVCRSSENVNLEKSDKISKDKIKEKVKTSSSDGGSKEKPKSQKEEKKICDKSLKDKISSSKTDAKVTKKSKEGIVSKPHDSKNDKFKVTKQEVKSTFKEKNSKEKTTKESLSSKKSSKSDDKTKLKSSSTKTSNEKSKTSSEKSKSSIDDKSKKKNHEKTKMDKSDKNTSSSKKSSSEKSVSTSKSIDTQKKTSRKIQDEKISSSSVFKLGKSATLKFDDALDQKVIPEYIQSESIDEDVIMLSDDNETSSIGSNSDMDSETLWECWQIFNEQSDSNGDGKRDSNFIDKSLPKEEPLPSKEKSHVSGIVPVGKKRLAHQPDIKRKTKASSKMCNKILNPAQVMQNRYLTMQNTYSKRNEQKESSMFLNSLNKTVDVQKKRTATIPNSSLIAAVANKNRLLGTNTGTSSSNKVTTMPPTIVIKPTNRVAHIPAAALSPRPIIPASYGSKVASNIRQKYLNNFIDECLKFCLTEDQAYELALEEEKKAYERSTNKTIYLNVAANALNRLRRRARDGPPSDLPEDNSVPAQVTSTTSVLSSKKCISHEMMLAGPQSLKHSYSIEKRKVKKPDLVIRGKLLYCSLSNYVLSEDLLIENGFPMPHPFEQGQAVIQGIYANKQPLSNDPYKKICCRCSKTYFVDSDGEYVKQQECNFHWGRIFKQRIAGSLESRYTCCQGDAEADGCCVGPGHVYEGSDNHLLKGFVRTLQKSPPPDDYFGVFSLDCEMCYTTAGIELTRVTVIGPDMNAVFESFVKPEHPVLDYNTRFSGITEDDLVGITTSIRDIQAILLCMFNEKTILIGHSLESDFKALKLIHKTVVDTSVVFPHKLGPPYKRALRTLMAEKCSKIIQNSIDGHDSHEDAAACMELMLLKLKEDLKYSYR